MTDTEKNGRQGEGGGGPPGHTKAMKHGAYMSESRFFDNIPEKQQQHLISIFESYVEGAPFGYDDIAMASEVWSLAVDRMKRLRLNNYMADDGMIIEEEKVAPDGTIVTEKREHPAMLAFHRLDRDNLRRLEKFGIMEDMKKTQSATTSDGLSVEVTIHEVDSDGEEPITVESTSEENTSADD